MIDKKIVINAKIAFSKQVLNLFHLLDEKSQKKLDSVFRTDWYTTFDNICSEFGLNFGYQVVLGKSGKIIGYSAYENQLIKNGKNIINENEVFDDLNDCFEYLAKNLFYFIREKLER